MEGLAVQIPVWAVFLPLLFLLLLLLLLLPLLK